MKTLAEIKDEVAHSYGMTWDRVIMDRSIFDGTVDMVAKRYAAEAVKEAAEIAKLWNGMPHIKDYVLRVIEINELK